jgi:hypothetical protein
LEPKTAAIAVASRALATAVAVYDKLRGSLDKY